NAADSVLAGLPLADVAVVVPVEVGQGSDVVVRLILDPSRTLRDSLPGEVGRAASMHIEYGITPYAPSMRAALVAPGADVTSPGPAVMAVPNRARTVWMWAFHATDPGRRKLLITLSNV